jgi:hypothetical protein
MDSRVCLICIRAGQSARVKNDDGDMLEQAESLDSDEMRNNDGDQVVDPPDEWIGVQDNGSLDDKLAAEVPDVSGARPVPADAHDSRHAGALGLVSDADLDGIIAGTHGRTRGQIDGTPEDGDSFFDVEE